MNTNNTVRDKATPEIVDWFMKLQDAEWKRIKNKYALPDVGNITDEQIARIYLSEHPQDTKVDTGLADLEDDIYGRYHPQSKDTVPEMEWDLYPGNEAGAFDHLDNEQFNEDMATKALEEDTVPVQGEGFTKGQWKVFIQPSNEGSVRTINVGSKRIATLEFMPTIEESEANALLIANAPAMYAALKEWVRVINRTDAAKHYYGEITERTEAILNRIDNK